MIIESSFIEASKCRRSGSETSTCESLEQDGVNQIFLWLYCTKTKPMEMEMDVWECGMLDVVIETSLGQVEGRILCNCRSIHFHCP